MIDEDVLAAMARIRRPEYLVNPKAIELLQDQLPPPDGPSPQVFPFRPHPLMPLHGKKWQFPRDPFVEYEGEDEAWSRPIGYGREVDDETTFVALRVPFLDVRPIDLREPERKYRLDFAFPVFDYRPSQIAFETL